MPASALESQQRALILSSFVNRIGTGLFSAVSVLYFTRAVHLSASRVGLGLTIAGFVGLLSGIPVGHLADRRGPRSVTLATLMVQAVTMGAYVFIHDWTMFAVVAALDLLAQSANNAARGTLIARLGGAEPAAFRARLRVFVNLGLVVGTAGAGAAAALDTRAAYVALILANAASYLVCAGLLLRVPDFEPLPHSGGRGGMLSVLADLPYAAFSALYGLMGLEFQVPILLLPLWISQHTSAPRWAVSGVYLVNAALCMVLQVRVGRQVNDPVDGGRALRRAGLLFLAAAPVMALTADVPSWAAVALAFLGVGVHSLGQVLHTSAGFALGYGLAPDHAQGRYQGLMGIGYDLGQAIAPYLLTAVCLGLGQAGWLLLGGFLAALGLAGPPLTAWALRARADSPRRAALSAGPSA